MAEERDENNAADSHFSMLSAMVDQLSDELSELNVKRKLCERCDRPLNVCLCENLPDKIKLKNNIKVWVLQHPNEENRPLRTTRILEKSLDEKNFCILKGRRFTVDEYPELEDVYKSEKTFVLYPSDSSVGLNEFKNIIDASSNQNVNESVPNVVDSNRFNIILIDGTWPQASGIYWTNRDLHHLKQIKIDNSYKSVYTVRTQPRESFLSTLETVAVILSCIEDNHTIYDDLTKALKALCEHQFNHGAKKHQSKEYLIFKGQYKKVISKKSYNKLTKNSEFLQQQDNLFDHLEHLNKNF